MKKTTLLLAALLTTGASLSAAETASTYTITADFPYVTKYCFRSIKYAEDSFQPSVKLTTGDFYAGIWMNAPVDKGFELEIDYYAGYGFKLSDGLNLDVGATIYHYPGLDTPGADKSTFEAYAGLTGSIEGVNLGLYVYEDFTLDVFTIQGNLGYSIPIDDKTSMNWSATLGRAEPDAGSGYTYYGLGLAVPYKVSDKATVTVGAQFASHNFTGLEDNHFWGTLGYTYVF